MYLLTWGTWLKTIPAGCGRPVVGCVRGSSLALHFLGSADPYCTGPQTDNQTQIWSHTQTAPAAEDVLN